MAAVRRVWAAYFLVVLLVCVTVALGDEIVAFSIEGPPAALGAAPPAPPPASGGHPWHAGRARAFVVLADSLRWQTATDAAIMPNLARLSARGVRAKVTSTRDAVTVPAIRAAFKGVERTALFGFVTSLFRGKASVTSLFTDLRAEGRSAVAYSDGSFLQFGDDLVERSNEAGGAREIDRQNGRALEAARALAAGDRDLAVVHLTYTDHVAHEAGVFHPRYREHYGALDALVAELDRILPPEDTLVLLGDHGHDEAGRHSMGLDVPTFAFYRGPGFRAGVDLGTIAITDHRYLLGWALELPLRDDYRGGRHPEALAASGALPPSFAAAAAPAASTPGRVRALQWVLAIAVAALAGGALAGIARRVSGNGVTGRRIEVAAALAGVAFVGWGALLARMRPLVHEPRFTTIIAVWVAIALALPIAVRLAATRASPALRAWVPRVAFGLLLGALFLLYPTVYRYGAPAAMAPVWICGALALAAAAWPSRRALLAAAGVLVLLWPFKLAEAKNFQLAGWVSWPVQQIPGAWETLDTIALLLLFVRRQRPIAVALAVAAALIIRQIHVGEIELGRYEVVAALALALLAFALRVALRRGRAARAPDAELALVAAVERTLGLAALLVGFHAAVVARVSTHAAATLLLAAVGLSAPLVEGAPARAARWAYGVLGLLVVLAAGWVGIAWTVHLFEWHVLYAWFSAASVEKHIGWFLPLILVRYVLPARAARRLLVEGAPRAAAEAEAHLFTLAAVKATSLALVMLGIGLVQATSDVYLEAAQETAIWLVVMGGAI